MKCIDVYKESGVYAIILMNSHKWYIGSACNLYRRYKDHNKMLKSNRHPNVHLQRAYNKYGSNAFMFKLLCKVQKEKLLIAEQYFMDLFVSYGLGFNLKPNASNCLGRTLSEETKKKISLAHKGKKLSLKHRKAIGEGGKGRITSDKSRKNYKIANLGRLNPRAKLTKKIVMEIFRMLDNGFYQKDIAKKFNISRGHVSSIKRGLRWAHIQNW